jgi:hypothetical protein
MYLLSNSCPHCLNTLEFMIKNALDTQRVTPKQYLCFGYTPKSPIDVKKLSIEITCPLPCISYAKFNTTFWANFASPRAMRATSFLSSSFLEYIAKFQNKFCERACHVDPVKIRISPQESQFMGFCSFFSFLAGQVLTKVQVWPTNYPFVYKILCLQ